MDTDKIKKEIKKALESTISTIDPAFNLDDAIEYYFKILNYDLEHSKFDDLQALTFSKLNTLNRILVEKDFSDESTTLVGVFNNKFESFIKKLYYILEEFGEIRAEVKLDSLKGHAFNPFMAALNKSNTWYLDLENNPTLNKGLAKKDQYNSPIFKIVNGEKTYKRLYPNSIVLDKFSNPDDPQLSHDHNNSFIYHFQRAYILRNKESHSAPAYTILQVINNLQSTLISELWVTDFLKEKLKIGLLYAHGEKMDFTEYIENEISRLSNQSKKYVDLSIRLYSSQKNNENNILENLGSIKELRLRILGVGGSGKTTSLENIVYRKCILWREKKSDKIPVLIFLSNIRTDESIRDAISKKLSIHTELVDELIQRNKIILLFDGINEMVKDRESKKEKIKEIANIIENNKELEIVISDRYSFDSYQDDPFKLLNYGIDELSESQIYSFVQKYCQNTEHSPDAIIKILQSKPNIQKLLNRPLILSRAIEIIKLDKELPEKEGQIIEKFIDLMLIREKNEKMDPLLNIRSFKLLLGYLANRIYSDYKINSPINEFKCLKIINEGAEVLGLEKFNAGYSLRIGYELEILTRKDELIQFYHQTFFEYFVKHYTKYELS